MSSTFVEHTLPNGLRIVCEVMPRVRSVAIGFLARTGSRHEGPHEHGVSHFLEHMCFKGTAKRHWHQITIDFDRLGSIYNAYTSKEHTVYFGWVPADRYAEQLELLADMMRPALPADEYETERKVILEEIAMNDDSFDRHVSNFAHRVVFGDHPLAHEILGEREAIEQMPREVMVEYLERRYSPENMVLFASGAVDPDAFFAEAGRCCGEWPRQTAGPGGAAPELQLGGVHKLQLDRFKQQSLVLVYPAIPAGHEDEETLSAFTSLFGGGNSRCYWNIVQKGICQHAGAAWLSYLDCGVLALYADGQPDQCERMLAALREQAQDVVANGFDDREVQRVRNQRRTQLALEAENPRTRMMQLIDDIETYDRTMTVESRLAAVDAVTPARIEDYFRRYPLDGEPMLISCGPRDWPTNGTE